MPKESPQRQVNVRLTQSDYDVLQALAWLDKTGETEIVRGIVVDYIEEHRSDETVQAALRLQAHHQAKKEGKVSDLPQARRSRSSRGGGGTPPQ